MLRFLTSCAVLGLALCLEAAEIKLDTLKVGDRVYTNVTITSFTATDVYFSHSKGVSSAKLRNVEPNVQKLLQYDPAVAEAMERQQQQLEKRYEGALATSIAARASQPVAVSPENEEHFADPISDKSLLGKHAPKIEVEKWLSDQPDLEGKFVLVSFWSTKSATSRKWLAQLNAWQKKFKSKLQIVGISSEPEAEVAALAQPKIEFASAIDTKAKLASAVGATTVPFVLFTDPKGNIIYYGHPAALNEAMLQSTLAKPLE